jgi:hypothetical protein
VIAVDAAGRRHFLLRRPRMADNKTPRRAPTTSFMWLILGLHNVRSHCWMGEVITPRRERADFDKMSAVYDSGRATPEEWVEE